MLEFLTGEPARIPLRNLSTSRALDEATNMPGLMALFKDKHQQALEALREEAGLHSTT